MKRIVVSGAVLALAVSGVGMSQAAPAVYKVTGGGQTLAGTSGGAGNTIAFNARGNADDADGQLQFVDRTGGRGQDQVVRHGLVDCVVVHSATDDGGEATIGGVFRDTGERFTLDVIDMGEGRDAGDVVEFRDTQAVECAERDEEDDEPEIELARGNVQVHKAKGGKGGN